MRFWLLTPDSWLCHVFEHSLSVDASDEQHQTLNEYHYCDNFIIQKLITAILFTLTFRRRTLGIARKKENKKKLKSLLLRFVTIDNEHTLQRIYVISKLQKLN